MSDDEKAEIRILNELEESARMRLGALLALGEPTDPFGAAMFDAATTFAATEMGQAAFARANLMQEILRR